MATAIAQIGPGRGDCLAHCLYRIQALESLLTKASRSAAAQPQPSKDTTAVDFGPSTASTVAPDSALLSAQAVTAVVTGGSASPLQPSTAVQAAPIPAQQAPGPATSSANVQEQQEADLTVTAAASSRGEPSSDFKAAGNKGLTAPGSYSA